CSSEVRPRLKHSLKGFYRGLRVPMPQLQLGAKQQSIDESGIKPDSFVQLTHRLIGTVIREIATSQRVFNDWGIRVSPIQLFEGIDRFLRLSLRNPAFSLYQPGIQVPRVTAKDILQ